MVDDVAGPHHRVFALSLKDGTLLPGWPVDIATALAAQGQRFEVRPQNQRGALAILDGRVYVPYGGHYGDCGDYRGWVVGIRLRDDRDADLGGTNPLPLDVPGAGGSAALLLALGKDARAYLLDRNRLGGIGGSLLSETVATRPILAAPAAYRTGDEVYVAFQGP